MNSVIYEDPEKRLSQLKDYNFPPYLIMGKKDLMNYESGFGEEVHWHYLLDLMYTSLNGARTAFSHKLIEASIFYSISALEFGLKLKKCVILAKTASNCIADKWLIYQSPTLGTFSETSKLTELGICNLSREIIGLNKLRSGLFHFNYEKLKNAIKSLSFNFSEWEEKGMQIIYPNMVNDSLAINTNNLVINLLERVLITKK